MIANDIAAELSQKRPVADDGAAGRGREVVENAARQQRPDQHADAVGDERDETLSGAAQVRRRRLVGVELAGDEEEVVADAVQQDRNVEHPHAGAGIADTRAARSGSPTRSSPSSRMPRTLITRNAIGIASIIATSDICPSVILPAAFTTPMSFR